MKIQARLESVTFGKVVSKYYIIPNVIIDSTSDNDLQQVIIGYLLNVSEYRKHKNEIFTFWTK